MLEKEITYIMNQTKNCTCGNPHHEIPIQTILVGNHVLKQVATFLEEQSLNNVVVIADPITFCAAGNELVNYLEQAKVRFSSSILKADENNDIVADEKSIVQALLETPQDTDVVIAVGAGTIHDIARFTSTKMKIPFISVPTAPSVDGFTSMGAPLIVRGIKTTFQMSAPIAVFADLNVLKNAPKKMIAAGFGDMLAKYTSLADWKFGHLVAGEPYCPLVAEITRKALVLCVENADKIAALEEEGVQVLIEALIKSGLAMLVFGQSHPASGGEHHLSHYWEMDFLRRNQPQVLHGAKVGISTTLLADVYKQEFLPFLSDVVKLEAKLKSPENLEVLINIQTNIEEIEALYSAIPNSSELRELIGEMGGETHVEELGISNALLAASLKQAHYLRERYTALKYLNEVAKVHYYI